MYFRQIYDDSLAQAAYLIGCQRTGEALLVDPERDIDRYQDIAVREGLRIVAVTETHIHADYLSGVREFVEKAGARAFLSGEGGPDWQYQWADGNDACTILADGDVFPVGNIEFKALHTPGHTPEHMCFLVTDRGSGADEPMGLCSGDFIFVGDIGRPDLLETAAGQKGAKEASAEQLFKTMGRIDGLSDWLQIWPGHGAGSACGKALGAIPQSTLGYERRYNPALRAAGDHDAFINYVLEGQPEPPLYFARMKRDNRLGPPVLGELPRPAQVTADGLRKIDTQETAVIDVRPWSEFQMRHLAGSLWSPLNHNLPIVAGSYVDEGSPILLIAEPQLVGTIVRMLIRIGLDNIVGFATPETLAEAFEQGARRTCTKEIDADELRSLRDEFTILDVRRATEFAEGAIEGATNIAHTRLGARLEEIPTGGPLVVHCLTGIRSAEACSYLERCGIDVINLSGGWTAWLASGARAQAAGV
jgi:hydroxyacylglutathione hydrolase